MFFIIELNPDTGQADLIERLPDEGEAIAAAKAHLAFLPSSAIESGFTVIVEDNKGNRIWGVGT